VAPVLARHAEEIQKIAHAYTERSYGKMIWEGIKLLANRDVWQALGSAVKDVIKFKYNESVVPSIFRRLEAGDEVIKNLQQALTEPHVPTEALPDLGQKLEILADKTDKKLLKFSLKNRDLRGFNLSSEEGLKFDNVKIDGFNFDDTKMKNCSFEGSLIQNTSFKDAVFKSKISFRGATIDGATLATLLPAIIKYNQQEGVADPITLDDVKIVGDISKLSLKELSLKNADISEAITYSTEGKKTYRTDVFHADLSDVKFREGQKEELGNVVYAKVNDQAHDKSFIQHQTRVLDTLKKYVIESTREHPEIREITTEQIRDSFNEKIKDPSINLSRAVENLEKNPKELAATIVRSMDQSKSYDLKDITNIFVENILPNQAKNTSVAR